ncbi:hypothetical protein V5O48_009852 [Marasmius crinis-equi]|uniref:Uncharacterized protein n=1 Tax=Marasmius crinis-equi TaxID=585013 RepID=A0ABR3FAG7_9AGAR
MSQTLETTIQLHHAITSVLALAGDSSSEPTVQLKNAWTNWLRNNLLGDNDVELKKLIIGFLRHWRWWRPVLKELVTPATTVSPDGIYQEKILPLSQCQDLHVLEAFKPVYCNTLYAPLLSWTFQDAMTFQLGAGNPYWAKKPTLPRNGLCREVLEQDPALLRSSHCDVKTEDLQHGLSEIKRKGIFPQFVVVPSWAAMSEAVEKELDTVAAVFGWLVWLIHGQNRMETILVSARRGYLAVRSPAIGTKMTALWRDSKEDSCILFLLSTHARAAEKLLERMKLESYRAQWYNFLQALKTGEKVPPSFGPFIAYSRPHPSFVEKLFLDKFFDFPTVPARNGIFSITLASLFMICTSRCVFEAFRDFELSASRVLGLTEQGLPVRIVQLMELVLEHKTFEELQKAYDTWLSSSFNPIGSL